MTKHDTQPVRARAFSHYDRRNYETHDVREGYARWAPVYDARMDDRLDLDLFDRSPWLSDVVRDAEVVDLACGTGRVGRWLRARGASRLVGVDLCAQMLRIGRAHYDAVHEADVCDTGLDARFDGATSSMALCHIEHLSTFYREAARLLRPGGFLFIVDFHPFFLMNGIPTHFDDPETGVSHAVQDHPHAMTDYFRDADRWFEMVEFDERFVDQRWVDDLPGFGKYLGWPVTLSAGYRRR